MMQLVPLFSFGVHGLNRAARRSRRVRAAFRVPAAKPGLFIVLRIHEIEETALRVTPKAVELLSFCDDCLQRRRVCDQRGVQSGLVFSLLSGTSRERERERERRRAPGAAPLEQATMDIVSIRPRDERRERRARRRRGGPGGEDSLEDPGQLQSPRTR